jgi:hypothetical protein
MKRKSVMSVESRSLIVILVVLLIVSLAIPVYEGIANAKVPSSWNTPVVLLALYAIVKLVGSLPEFHTDVRFLRDVANVRVQLTPNVKDFYESLDKALDQSTSTVDLTHIRDSPPADFGPGAGGFFERVVDWCGVEGRSVRRIICVRSPAMYDWARELAAKTEHLPQFKIRVINWTIDAPAMNMAIFDEKVVYLALTGSTLERTRGLGIEDQTATQYFNDYYDNLWRSSEDLRQWLADNSWEGA